jgi:hypothetical protein
MLVINSVYAIKKEADMIFGLFKKKPSGAGKKAEKPEGELVGEITHYFSRCKVGIVKLVKPLAVGDRVRVIGHTTDFKQKITSLQIDNKAIESAAKGKEAGFVVKNKVRSGDKVYRL